MQTTDSGITFVLHKSTRAESQSRHQDGSSGRGKKSSKASSDSKATSDQNKGKTEDSGLPTPNLGPSRTNKKGGNKATQENISTHKLPCKPSKKGKAKLEENTCTQEVARANEDVTTMSKLGKAKKSQRGRKKDKRTDGVPDGENLPDSPCAGEASTEKASTGERAIGNGSKLYKAPSRRGKKGKRTDGDDSSSAGEASTEKASTGKDTQGFDHRNRKIRASRAQGEIVKEGVKTLYKHHYSLQKVEEGLEKKTLYQGTLRINKRNRAESYVTVKGRDQDIFIQGVVARNRALNGDIVVIELLVGAEHDKQIEMLKQNIQEKSNKEEERLKNVSIVDEQEDILIEDIMEKEVDEVDEELEDSGITNVSGNIFLNHIFS